MGIYWWTCTYLVVRNFLMMMIQFTWKVKILNTFLHEKLDQWNQIYSAMWEVTASLPVLIDVYPVTGCVFWRLHILYFKLAFFPVDDQEEYTLSFSGGKCPVHTSSFEQLFSCINKIINTMRQVSSYNLLIWIKGTAVRFATSFFSLLLQICFCRKGSKDGYLS